MLKNVTFSVEESDLATARESARRANTTLNELVRHWIAEYANRGDRASHIEQFFEKLEHVRAGRKFTREEMNER